MKYNITKNTIGYTVVVDHKSGGSLGTWVPTLPLALKHVKKIFDKNHTYARIIKTKYKDRMRLK